MDEVAGVDEVLRAHESAGSRFTADGIGSFVLRAGAGEPVVLMHGVPASSFLYRKVIPELATRGYDALGFDLPGLGLADRSPDLDYTVPGLARFSVAAVDSLGPRPVPPRGARRRRAGRLRDVPAARRPDPVAHDPQHRLRAQQRALSR